MNETKILFFKDIKVKKKVSPSRATTQTAGGSGATSTTSAASAAKANSERLGNCQARVFCCTQRYVDTCLGGVCGGLEYCAVGFSVSHRPPVPEADHWFVDWPGR